MGDERDSPGVPTSTDASTAGRQRAARLGEWLDIYSPRVGSRVVVLALMATGAALLAGKSLSGVWPFALLVWANRRRFLTTLGGLVDRNAWVVVALALAVVAARAAWPPPAAPDDLLRHIAVAFWPDGYAGMYVGSSLPPVNLYPLFDAAVGAIARATSPQAAMWIAQAVAFVLFVGVLLVAARRIVAGHPDAPFLLLAVLICTTGSMLPRLLLARPEMFLTIWAISAALVRAPVHAVGWVVAGAVLNATYWLAPIYFPAVLLFEASRRVRLAAFAALCGSWIALWLWIAGDELVPAMLWQFRSMASWVPGLRVDENIGIFNALSVPLFWPLLVGALWAASRGDGRRSLLWVALWFAASNQIRYIGVIAPLLALYVASAVPRRVFLGSVPARLVALSTGLVLAAAPVAPLTRYRDLPRMQLPAGAVVFTHFDQATYSLPFHNPGRIRIAPSFALGALDRELQVALRELLSGRLDCALLRRHGFTHVVERSMLGEPPPCLELVSVEGPRRLWRIGAVQ